MEDRSSCNTGRERLGLCFTIDYLLYNKDSKCMREEQNIPAVEQTPHSLLEGQSPDILSERKTIKPGSPEKGPEGEEGSEEENEEEEEIKGGKDEEETTTDSPQDKPSQSYISLISMAILASEEKKLLLCDIYHWIMDRYPYFKSKVCPSDSFQGSFQVENLSELGLGPVSFQFRRYSTFQFNNLKECHLFRK